ncbi:hypothetical protein KCU86_g17201, partial [Aureobasidium melanogenum]
GQDKFLVLGQEGDETALSLEPQRTQLSKGSEGRIVAANSYPVSDDAVAELQRVDGRLKGLQKSRQSDTVSPMVWVGQTDLRKTHLKTSRVRDVSLGAADGEEVDIGTFTYTRLDNQA